jgi:hypothetical protein
MVFAIQTNPHPRPRQIPLLLCGLWVRNSQPAKVLDWGKKGENLPHPAPCPTLVARHLQIIKEKKDIYR